MESERKDLSKEEILTILESAPADPGECGDPEIACVGLAGACKEHCKENNKDGTGCQVSCLQGCSEGCKPSCKPGNK